LVAFERAKELSLVVFDQGVCQSRNTQSFVRIMARVAFVLSTLLLSGCSEAIRLQKTDPERRELLDNLPPRPPVFSRMSTRPPADQAAQKTCEEADTPDFLARHGYAVVRGAMARHGDELHEFYKKLKQLQRQPTMIDKEFRLDAMEERTPNIFKALERIKDQMNDRLGTHATHRNTSAFYKGQCQILLPGMPCHRVDFWHNDWGSYFYGQDHKNHLTFHFPINVPKDAPDAEAGLGVMDFEKIQRRSQGLHHRVKNGGRATFMPVNASLSTLIDHAHGPGGVILDFDVNEFGCWPKLKMGDVLVLSGDTLHFPDPLAKHSSMMIGYRNDHPRLSREKLFTSDCIQAHMYTDIDDDLKGGLAAALKDVIHGTADDAELPVLDGSKTLHYLAPAFSPVGGAVYAVKDAINTATKSEESQILKAWQEKTCVEEKTAVNTPIGQEFMQANALAYMKRVKQRGVSGQIDAIKASLKLDEVLMDRL